MIAETQKQVEDSEMPAEKPLQAPGKLQFFKEVLAKKQKDDLAKGYQPIAVEKHLECRIDVGMMICADPNDFDEKALKDDQEKYLCSLTRDNTQLLVNALWQLPTEWVDESIVAKLPKPTTTLPRLRKPPGPKPLTRWEQFAKEKGIKKKKGPKKTYDEVLQKWVPNYGFKRVEAEKERDWILEVPANADDKEDMFQKRKDLRNEKVAKNEIHRMKNIARAQKVDTPRSGYLGPEAASSQQLLTAATIAKASTASVGKFQEKLSNDKVARGLGVKELIPGLKRKAVPVSGEAEKEVNLELIKSVLNKKPKIDVEKAISLQKREAKLESENAEPATRKKAKPQGKGSRKAVGRKPKGGHGKHAKGKNHAFGRKRR